MPYLPGQSEYLDKTPLSRERLLTGFDPHITIYDSIIYSDSQMKIKESRA